MGNVAKGWGSTVALVVGLVGLAVALAVGADRGRDDAVGQATPEAEPIGTATGPAWGFSVHRIEDPYGGLIVWPGELPDGARVVGVVGSSRVDLQACKLEYSIVSPK